jgi:hypothetical protein
MLSIKIRLYTVVFYYAKCSTTMSGVGGVYVLLDICYLMLQQYMKMIEPALLVEPAVITIFINV